MSGYGSGRPSINTSADAVLRRLDQEFEVEASGVTDLARARIRPLALVAIVAGAGMVAAALLAPILLATVGGLLAAAGVLGALVVADDDEVTGIGQVQRRCRRSVRRLTRRRRHSALRRRSARRSSVPIGSRFAPWLFPDPTKARRQAQ